MKVAYLILPALFFFGGTAHAQNLFFAHLYKHDGLIFSSPLSFSQTPTTLNPTTLEFGTSEKIDIQPTTKSEVAIEAIITPTPTPVVPNKIIPIQISPTPSPLPTSTPTPTPQQQVISPPPNPGGLNADLLFSMVNSYRASKGLPAFQKDEKTCSLAGSRAPEVENEVASGTMHSGLHNRNLDYWNTENIISMRNETEAFNWWINDQIHKEAIESNNTYSCVACSGNSCAEEFTNYQPK
jgi:uncharacterized protein YkwD